MTHLSSGYETGNKARPRQAHRSTCGTVPAVQRPEVVLYRDGLALDMVPCRDHILGRLTTVEHMLVNDADSGTHIEQRIRRLCPSIRQRGVLAEITGIDELRQGSRSLLGLEPAVRRLIEADGCMVRFIDTVGSLPTPDFAGVQRVGTSDDDFISSVSAHPRLLVRHGHRVNIAWLIAQVSIAYPAATIAVGVARRHAAQRIGDELRHWLPNDVSILRTGPEPASTRRVIVGTLSALGACSARLCHRDVFVVDAMDALSESGKSALSEARRARFIGLLPQDGELSAHDMDALRSILGFAEVTIPAHGRCLRPVEVLFKPVVGGPRIETAVGLAGFHREAIWANPQRNRRIVRLAQALHTGDNDLLHARFPATAAAWPSCSPKRVVVVVEAVEHALHLLHALPDCGLVAAEINEKRLSPADRSVLGQSRSRQNAAVQVVTAAALSNFDLSDVEVVVRADGGCGDLPIRNQQLIVEAGDADPLLLIDFQDTMHPQLRRWSRSRRAAYAARGWHALGADPIEERVTQFLANRPR